MKRVVLGLVATAALIVMPASTRADRDDWDRGDYRHHGWDSGYHGGRGGGYRSGGHHGGYHGGWWGHGCYRRPPRVVYRPAYPAYPTYDYGYGGYGTSFYYSGPNAAFGFGF